MHQLQNVARISINASRTVRKAKEIHSSVRRLKISEFLMPAMSPTMSEGGISRWKVTEGSKFSAGEVLLEIETDKATIDVEAQDDGVLGKIIAADGSKNIEVGELIALLAEEGDDVSNLEVPKKKESSSSKQQDAKPSVSASPPSTSTSTTQKTSQSQPIKIDHSKPMFPSVLRLLEENGISPEKVKGTGIRGMLTKGDVLAFMGQARSPTGTWNAVKESPIPASTHKPVKELTSSEIRRLIVEGLSDMNRSQQRTPSLPPATYDSILAGYTTSVKSKPVQSQTPSQTPREPTRGYLDGLI